MPEKVMVCVVVGSHDAREHGLSVEDGREAVNMIDNFADYQACLMEVSLASNENIQNTGTFIMTANKSIKYLITIDADNQSGTMVTSLR